MTAPEIDSEQPQNCLAMQVKALLWEKGRQGLQLAKDAVLHEDVESNQLHEAMTYFMASWQDVVHPAMLALTCEAVGGNPKITEQVVLLLPC
jgi:hypothetical protein